MRIFLVILMLSVGVLGYPGQLDSTFDSDGVVLTDIGSNKHWYNAVTTQSDGKIVAVGRYYGKAPDRFGIVARYNNDGSLDFLLTEDEVILDDIKDVAIQPNGKILITGSYNQDFAMVRLNTDGSLDSSLGNNGLVTTDMDGDSDESEAILIQNDEKIILAGRAIIYGSGKFALARYLPDGTLDRAFGVNGIVSTDIPGGDSDIRDIFLQRDGKILAVGHVGLNSTFDSFALARYNSNGSLDSTFGGMGMVTTSIGNEDAHINAVAVDSLNTIYVAGFSKQFGTFISTIAKYSSNGTLDPAFGNGGILLEDKGKFNDIVLVKNGFFVTGYEQSKSVDLMVNKYHSNGNADLSWNGSGKAKANFNNHSHGNGLAIDRDNKVVVVGQYGKSSGNLTVVRFNNN